PRHGLLFRFRADPVLLTRVLFSLCSGEAEKRGISWDEFGAAFSGDRLNAARIAMEDEVVNFTPDPKIRSLIQTARKMLREWMDKGTAQAQKNLENPKLQEAEERELKRLESSFLNLLDNSGESTPDPSPSGNSSSPPKPPIETVGTTPP
ncbi:hypothetical protein LCGC14_2963510, partial [marine sediment metagenome]